jgi:hypothetical protein
LPPMNGFARGSPVNLVTGGMGVGGCSI